MISIQEAVRQICLGLPETEEIISHGMPLYKAAGKGFANFSLNHHSDGMVALHLNIGLETQEMLVQSAPDYFFVPPYTGPKGWVGIDLNKDLSWDRVAQLSWESYCRMVPASLARTTVPVTLKDKVKAMTPEEVNPLLQAANQKIYQQLQKICLALPETSESAQFGDPSFRAGKKGFCTLCARTNRIYIQIWAGPEQQENLPAYDQRFSIPPYIGHNGWLNLDLTRQQDWDQITQLVLDSYRHFALKRMLKALDN